MSDVNDDDAVTVMVNVDIVEPAEFDATISTAVALCTIVGVRDTLTALLAGASVHILDLQRAPHAAAPEIANSNPGRDVARARRRRMCRDNPADVGPLRR